MGFGVALKMKIDSIPTMLGYWLVQNYNEEANNSNVGNHTIHINAGLIHSLTGILNGNVAMMTKRTSKNDKVVAEWKGQFKGTSWIKRLGVKAYFEDILLEMDDYGRNFRPNFLDVFFTIIGHASDNAIVNQQFFHSVEPNIEINQMKWSDYLFECLQQAKKYMDTNKTFHRVLDRTYGMKFFYTTLFAK
ncbi:hypothetical protein Hanom_Chr13g01191071 [Helianthus anomalus]